MASREDKRDSTPLRKKDSKDRMDGKKVSKFLKKSFKSIGKDERQRGQQEDALPSNDTPTDTSGMELYGGPSGNVKIYSQMSDLEGGSSQERAHLERLRWLRAIGLWPEDKDPFAKQDPVFNRIRELWELLRAEKMKIGLEESKVSRELVKELVLMFRPEWMEWGDEYELDAELLPKNVRLSFYIPLIDRSLGKIIVNCFSNAMSALSDAIGSKELLVDHMDHITQVFFVSVLMRASYNLEVLMTSDLFDNVLRLIKIVLVSFPAEVNIDIRHKRPPADEAEAAAFRQAVLLQLVVANCFKIILFASNGQQSWREVAAAGSPIPAELLSAKLGPIVIIVKRNVVKSGIFQIISGYLDNLLQAAKKRDGGIVGSSQQDMVFILLNTVGAVLYKFPEAREKLTDGSMFDVLIALLGWPEHVFAQVPSTIKYILPSTKGMKAEYNLQFIVLQLLCEASFDNETNAQRISALGGWQKILDVILWITEVFSINPVLVRSALFGGRRGSPKLRDRTPERPVAPKDPLVRAREDSASEGRRRWSKQVTGMRGADCDDDDEPFEPDESLGYTKLFSKAEKGDYPRPTVLKQKAPCQELSHLFQLLLASIGPANPSLTHQSYNSSIASPLSTTHDDGVAPSRVIDVPVSKMNRVIVTLVLDLFNIDVQQSANNIRVRRKLKSEYPELQLFVLDFMLNMFTQRPHTVTLCRRYRLWDRLFSEFFLYAGREANMRMTAEQAALNKKRDRVFTMLQKSTLSFLEFAATRPANDNVEECQKLLELFDTHHDNSKVVLMASESLLRILQHNLAQTQRSLMRLNAISVIIMIITMQRSMIGLYSTGSPQSIRRRGSHSAHLFRAARFAALAVFNYSILNNTDAKAAVVRDSKTTRLLFSLLFEPSLSRFAISLLRMIMALPIAASKSGPPGMTTTSVQQDVLRLYSEFFELFHSAQVGTLPIHYETLLLLLETIRAVVKNNIKTQRIFKESGAFLNIITLLNVEERTDRLPRLTSEVLQTLTCLMAGNSKNKRHMRDDIGYLQLHSLVKRALSHDTHDRLHGELPTLLFNMIVDGSFDIDSNYTIRNADAVELIFLMVTELSADRQAHLVNSFMKIVEKSPLNQSLCCRRHSIYEALTIIPSVAHNDRFLGQLISLIEIMGTHSITVRELKRLFSLFRSEQFIGADGEVVECRPPAQTRLMKALQFMALSRSDGSPAFWDLNGRDTALCIQGPVTCMDKVWPQSHGYSFCCWFRAESFSDPVGKPKYQPRLFSLLDDQGRGIELYFTPGRAVRQIVHHLTLFTHGVGGKVTETVLEDIVVQEKRWHFIVLTHSSQSRARVLFHQSEVRLYVNGQLGQKVSVKYPQMPAVLHHLTIGSNDVVPGRASRENPFFGQLGTVYFVEDVLQANQVKLLHQAGASFDVCNIKGDQQLESGGPQLASHSSSTIVRGDGRKHNDLADISSKIFLYYNCLAFVGKLYLDITPEQNRELRLHAKPKNNVHSCVTRDVKDIIHCLGGIKVLFPLFSQLNQPRAPLAGSDVDYSIDNKLILQVLALLGDMLSSSETNQREMLRCHGFGIVQHLIHRASPLHLTSETLVTLEDVANKVDLDELKNQCYVELLYNWGLWIYATSEVQKEVMLLLATQFRSDMQLMRRLFSVQELVDVLFFFYWYEPAWPRLQGKHAMYHPVTKECVGQRPCREDIREVRRLLYQVLQDVANDGLNAEETRALVGYVLENRDHDAVCEAILFLYKLVLNDKSGIIDHIPIDPFYTLLRSDYERTRNLSLRFIGLLLHRGPPQPHLAELYKAMSTQLQTYPFGRGTYNVLFGLMTGRFPEDADDEGVDSILIDESVVIVVPAVLPCLFQLMLVGETQLRQIVLQHLYLLLSNSPKNREVMLKWYGWHDAFFAVLADPASDKEHHTHVIFEIVLNLFKTLLVHALKVDKNGWRVFAHLCTAMVQYSERGVLDREKVLRALYHKVISAIGAEGKVAKGDSLFMVTRKMDLKNALAIHNLMHLVSLVEEFIYYTPSQQDIEAEFPAGTDSSMLPSCSAIMCHHISQQGEWSDFALAESLMDALHELHVLAPKNLAHLEALSPKIVPLRQGGLTRILLRITLDLIRAGAVKVCVVTVPRIRSIIENHLNRSEPNSQLMFLLATMLRTLKTQLLSGSSPTEDAAGYSKAKAIVPLMKDLLRHCMPILPATAKEQGKDSTHSLQYFTESGSAKQFISSFSSPQWNALLQWADQIASGGTTEEREFCAAIEKQRIKLFEAHETEVLKYDKAEIAQERYLEEVFANLKSKYTFPEVERRGAAAAAMEEGRRFLARQWRRVWRSVSNERAPWGSKETEQHWKLDKTENLSRMRLKLKRNYNFDPHHGAARQIDDRTAPKQEPDVQQVRVKGINVVSLDAEEVDDDAVKEEADLDIDQGDAEADAAAAQEKQEKLMFSCTAELIQPMNITPGKVEITTTHIYFHEDAPEEDDSDDGTQGKGDESSSSPKELKIPLEQLREVHLRRYLLRRSALELFLLDRTNYFLNFKKRERNKVYNKIINLQPPNLSYYETGSPEQILKRSDLTRKWQMRQISNFDYLMQLNTIAGRTYNDLTQYPVFPWIICDYTSETINLNDPAVYRDLSKPVGALNPERLEQLLVRYENFCDPDIPQFLYGSHYSSSAIVLYYLIRVEPFTTHFLQLQGGKFDHADRMFYSIPNTWNGCYNAPTDFKELIPEFFYFPDFLVNSNRFNLGSKQSGEPMDHIQLPPWAATPEEFISINRAALESDYVSEHLHEWIDLVFGYKQRGRNAMEAYNVFYYLTYEGAVDIDAIEDEGQRRATESQIDNFGQTPSQLLRKPHPTRSPVEPSQLTLYSMLLKRASFSKYSVSLSSTPIVFLGVPGTMFSSQLVNVVSDRLITVDDSRVLSSNRLVSLTSGTPPYTFEQDSNVASRPKVGIPFHADLAPSSLCFACSSDGKMIFSCGHWDNTFKVTWADGSRPTQSINKHKDLVTCLGVAADGKMLVSGSRDTTLLVWDIVFSKGSPSRVDPNPLHILYGHDDEVTCVAVSYDLDVCVSGSRDGTCIVHSLSQGTYVHSMQHPNLCVISIIAVSCLGHIVIYSKEDRGMHVFNVNGKHQCSGTTPERLSSIIISRAADYMVCASEDGSVMFRNLYDLKVLHKVSFSSRIRCMTVTADERLLVCALDDGSVSMLASDLMG